MITYESVNEKGRALCQAIERELGDEWRGDALVFVGALGICVRQVLPTLQDKRGGQAVVCVDSTGRYAIPVVGGHAGGANELARRIARITGGEAVITTQSDNLGLWALDTLARDCGWALRGTEDINREIALFVGGEPTALVLEHRDQHTLRMEETCPEHVTVFRSFDEFLSLGREGDRRYRLLIIVSPRLHTPCGIPTLHYCPRTLHLGMGCQKLVSEEAASAIVQEIEANGYARESVRTVGTIDLKRDEPLLAELCRLLTSAEKRTYTPAELAAVDVPNPSPLVMGKVGSPSVAEAAALRGADGGYLVLPKQKGCADGLFYTFALASEGSRRGHIEIVGAGPGATDLISLRGRRFLERADLILFAGSLVPEELTRCAKQGAIVRSSASMSLDEQIELMKTFHDEGKLVVRLHTGDPSIYGATAEQMSRFDDLGLSYHVTPGISSFQAAAAELRSELTVPFGTQTVILTRHGGGRTPVPDSEQLESLAAHGSSMCLFLSASLVKEVQEALLKGAYTPDTPVAVCHKVTHRDQRIYRCRLAELEETVKQNGITLTAMIVVGEAVGNRKGKSFLYS